jgi:uncharacterized membrane protein YfhO
LAVFSEIYYPVGWQAYLNGEEVEHVRVNYVLRAMELPAGEHSIEFRFDAPSYRTGNLIMWISNILLLGLVLTGLVIGYRKNNKEVE